MPARLLHDDVFRRVCRARDYLHEHHARPLALAELARVAHLSPYHFLRTFRSAFGTTPHQYLIAARTLLREERGSVTDICLDVGFESLGSFSTLFAERMGCPPGAWRRRIWRIREEPHGLAQLAIPCCFWSRLSGIPIEELALAPRASRPAPGPAAALRG
jgi:AraC-like DNA-binding protein